MINAEIAHTLKNKTVSMLKIRFDDVEDMMNVVYNAEYKFGTATWIVRTGLSNREMYGMPWRLW